MFFVRTVLCAKKEGAISPVPRTRVGTGKSHVGIHGNERNRTLNGVSVRPRTVGSDIEISGFTRAKTAQDRSLVLSVSIIPNIPHDMDALAFFIKEDQT